MTSLCSARAAVRVLVSLSHTPPALSQTSGRHGPVCRRQSSVLCPCRRAEADRGTLSAAALLLACRPCTSLSKFGHFTRWCWLASRMAERGLMPFAIMPLAHVLPGRPHAPGPTFVERGVGLLEAQAHDAPRPQRLRPVPPCHVGGGGRLGERMKQRRLLHPRVFPPESCQLRPKRCSRTSVAFHMESRQPIPLVSHCSPSQGWPMLHTTASSAVTQPEFPGGPLPAQT